MRELFPLPTFPQMPRTFPYQRSRKGPSRSPGPHRVRGPQGPPRTAQVGPRGRRRLQEAAGPASGPSPHRSAEEAGTKSRESGVGAGPGHLGPGSGDASPVERRARWGTADTMRKWNLRRARGVQGTDRMGAVWAGEAPWQRHRSERESLEGTDRGTQTLGVRDPSQTSLCRRRRGSHRLGRGEGGGCPGVGSPSRRWGLGPLGNGPHRPQRPRAPGQTPDSQGWRSSPPHPPSDTSALCGGRVGPWAQRQTWQREGESPTASAAGEG